MHSPKTTQLKDKIGDYFEEALIAISGPLNVNQRHMIKNAGEKAGIIIKRIIYKSIAAAITYEFNLLPDQQKNEKCIVSFNIEEQTIEGSAIRTGENVIEVNKIEWDESINTANINIEQIKKFNMFYQNVISYFREIDDIIITGCSKYINAYQPLLFNILNRNIIANNNENTVAKGVALYRSQFSDNNKERLLIDVTTFSYAIKTSSGNMISVIPKNTNIPTSTIVELVIPRSKNRKHHERLMIIEENVTGIQNNCIGELEIILSSGEETFLEVGFSISTDYVFNVIVKNKKTNEEISIKI